MYEGRTRQPNIPIDALNEISPHLGEESVIAQGSLGERTEYSIRPPDREGGTKTVHLVTLNSDTYVLKDTQNSQSDAAHYKHIIETHPNADIYSRAVGACFGPTSDGKYQVMEYLPGISYHKIVEKLEHDEEFLSTYARTVWNTIKELTAAGFMTSDVAFLRGHNVAVESNGASLRFMEQQALLVSSETPPYTNSAMKELLHQVDLVSVERAALESNRIKNIPTPLYELAFTRELMRTALLDEDLKTEDLYVVPIDRYIDAAKTLSASQPLDDAALKRMGALRASAALYDKTGCQAKIFSPDVISTIMYGTIEEFGALLKEDRLQSPANGLLYRPNDIVMLDGEQVRSMIANSTPRDIEGIEVLMDARLHRQSL